ncbi:hypothetical protein ACI782_00790 [Geodermatophilus sp. SYSU D00703]
MTMPADDRALEAAFEAVLAGRPVSDGASGLAAFTDAVRSDAAAPGRPNAALAELLATGLLTPHQEPSLGTAGRPARTSRKRPRMLLPALIAKIASAGAVAKAAVGTGVVVVAVTGATTATVVVTQDDPPAVVQPAADEDVADENTAGSVEDDTRVPAGDAEDTLQQDAGDDDGDAVEEGDDSGDATADVASEEGVPADEDAQPVEDETEATHPDNFGAYVSGQAHDGGVDGQEISDAAHARNQQRKDAREAERAEAEEPETEVEAPEAEETEPETAEAVPAAEVESRGSGNGHGNGHGKGRGQE